MLIYKILRAPEWEAFDAAGETAGAPVDLADGYIHFSTAAQAAETAAKHFAGPRGCGSGGRDRRAGRPPVGAVARRAALPASLRGAPAEHVVWARPLPLGRGRPRLPGGDRVSTIERLGLAVFHRLDPDGARPVAPGAEGGARAAAGAGDVGAAARRPAGLSLPNPVGLAAGYDKNAEALAPLMRAGFGFLEVGAATPLPQPGNPRPRLFRLAQDRAAINRFGFNNDGAEAIAARLRRGRGGARGAEPRREQGQRGPGGRLRRVLRTCGAHVDFATVNVSSPNTEKLRDLQGVAALKAVLAGVMAARADLPRPIPVFVKIAPDLERRGDRRSRRHARLRIDGIIATNTTLARRGSGARRRRGGRAVGRAALRAVDARARAAVAADPRRGAARGRGRRGLGRAGLCQDPRGRDGGAALHRDGLRRAVGRAADLGTGLDALLERDGFASVAEAVATGRAEWL
jgi:dihydroorotate dehydrogenase